jgi:hypothetical protein
MASKGGGRILRGSLRSRLRMTANSRPMETDWDIRLSTHAFAAASA